MAGFRRLRRRRPLRRTARSRAAPRRSPGAPRRPGRASASHHLLVRVGVRGPDRLTAAPARPVPRTISPIPRPVARPLPSDDSTGVLAGCGGNPGGETGDPRTPGSTWAGTARVTIGAWSIDTARPAGQAGSTLPGLDPAITAPVPSPIRVAPAPTATFVLSPRRLGLLVGHHRPHRSRHESIARRGAKSSGGALAIRAEHGTDGRVRIAAFVTVRQVRSRRRAWRRARIRRSPRRTSQHSRASTSSAPASSATARWTTRSSFRASQASRTTIRSSGTARPTRARRSARSARARRRASGQARPRPTGCRRCSGPQPGPAARRDDLLPPRHARSGPPVPAGFRVVAGDAHAMTAQRCASRSGTAASIAVCRAPRSSRPARTPPRTASDCTSPSRAAGTGRASTAPTTGAISPSPCGPVCPTTHPVPCRRSRSSTAIRSRAGRA